MNCVGIASIFTRGPTRVFGQARPQKTQWQSVWGLAHPGRLSTSENLKIQDHTGTCSRLQETKQWYKRVMICQPSIIKLYWN